MILIHHFNKLSQGKSGRPNQRLRGSSVLPGWSENSLYILRRDRDNTLVVEPESKYGATQPFAIQLEEVAIDGGDTGLRFAFKGDPAGRKQAENREKVFTALTDLQATPDACTIKTLATRLPARTRRPGARRLYRIQGRRQGTGPTHLPRPDQTRQGRARP